MRSGTLLFISLVSIFLVILPAAAQECSATKKCATGCCSKFGFCGFGKDYCSPEVCVAGCNAKLQCDPGTFGADYVELQKCPLNACSKRGYCGATAEFCTDKKFKRPSCPLDSTKPMKRVVSYYEGRPPPLPRVYARGRTRGGVHCSAVNKSSQVWPRT